MRATIGNAKPGDRVRIQYPGLHEHTRLATVESVGAYGRYSRHKKQLALFRGIKFASLAVDGQRCRILLPLAKVTRL